MRGPRYQHTSDAAFAPTKAPAWWDQKPVRSHWLSAARRTAGIRASRRDSGGSGHFFLEGQRGLPRGSVTGSGTREWQRSRQAA